MTVVREVEGMKIALLPSAEYFKNFATASMYSTWKETGADVVALLGTDVRPEDVSDDQLRDFLATMAEHTGRAQ